MYIRAIQLFVLVFTVFTFAVATHETSLFAKERSFSECVESLRSDQWLVREQALTDLKEMAGSHLTELASIITTESPEVQWRIASILNSLDWLDPDFVQSLRSHPDLPQVLPLLHHGLTLNNATVRRSMIKILANRNSVESLTRIQQACDDYDPQVLEAAAIAIGLLDQDGSSEKAILQLLIHDTTVIQAGLQTILKLNWDSQSVFQEVYVQLDSNNANISELALQHIQRHHGKSRVPVYLNALNESSSTGKILACHFLTDLKSKRAIEPLIAILQESVAGHDVKQAAAKAIASIGGNEAVTKLQRLYVDSERGTRVIVLDILTTLEPEIAKSLQKKEGIRFQNELEKLILSMATGTAMDVDNARSKLSSFGKDAHEKLWILIRDKNTHEDVAWMARKVIAESFPTQLMILQLLENKIETQQMQYILQGRNKNNPLSNLEWIFNSASPHKIQISWREVNIPSKLDQYSEELSRTLQANKVSQLLLADFIVSTHGLNVDFLKKQIRFYDTKKIKNVNALDVREDFKSMIGETIPNVRLAGMVGFSFFIKEEDLEFVVKLADLEEGVPDTWKRHVVLAVEKLARKNSRMALKQLHTWMQLDRHSDFSDAARHALMRISDLDYATNDSRWIEYLDSYGK